MITLSDIKASALKIWNKQLVQQSLLTAETVFPLKLAVPKFTARALREDFAEIKTWAQDIYNNSKPVVGFGYAIEYTDVNHQQLGKQRLPRQLVFDQPQDFVSFIGKQTHYKKF